MIQVNCIVKDLHCPDAGEGACSFFVSKPFSFEKLREGFPFEGDYHFRVQHKVIILLTWKFLTCLI